MYMLRTNEHDPQSTIKKTNYRCGLVVKWKKKKVRCYQTFQLLSGLKNTCSYATKTRRKIGGCCPKQESILR